MEDTLGVIWYCSFIFFCSCLNPCSNGRYSRSPMLAAGIAALAAVLILVLMEDTLGETRADGNGKNNMS